MTFWMPTIYRRHIVKTISNEELTKFIGEIDGITVRRSSNIPVKVYIDICGKEIEVISDGHSIVDHHITRTGLRELLTKKLKP